MRTIAKAAFIDSIGTMIAGRGEDAARTLHAALTPLPGGRSGLWFAIRFAMLAAMHKRTASCARSFLNA